MDSLLLCSAFLCLIINGALSWCPPLSTVPLTPRNTLSRPRTLNENCCQREGTCSCGEGLQCCANSNFRFLCVADPCDPNPCGNGVCATDTDGSRRCFCAVGSIRDRNGLCIEDPCFRNPCGRGGRCSTSFFDTRNAYTCRCSGDQIFDGKTCVANTCNRLRCGRGQCSINIRGRAVCECVSGFRFDGRSCVRDDPCRSHSCGAGGHCREVNRRAVCRCNLGFRLDSLTRTCVNDDPCANVNCGRGTCARSGPTRAVCNCDSGFTFDFVRMTCVEDRNPCRGITCGGRGRCRVARERPVCQCFFGFRSSASRLTCIDDPCSRLVCGRARCMLDSTLTRPRCVCPPGLRFDGRACIPFASRTTTTSAPAISQPAVISDPVTVSLGGDCGPGFCNCDTGFQHNRNTDTCQVVRPCQASSTQSTFELGDSGAARIPVRSTFGCLKSRNFPQPYPNDLFDEVIIPTNGFQQLTVIIQEMEIQISGGNTQGFVQNNCFHDYLFIGGQLFCGSLTPESAHRVITVNVQGRSEVIIGMVSDNDTSFQGFLLKWELS